MKKILSLLAALALAVSLAGCGGAASSASRGASAAVPGASSAQSAPAASAAQKPAQDRSGAAIALPEEIDAIAVMAPSIAETVVDLGLGDLIVAIDTQTESYALEGVPAGVPAFDMQAPDTEALAALAPDVVFVSGISIIEGENLFQPLTDMGICVASIPTSNSLADIKLDIQFLADCLGVSDRGRAINEAFQAELDRIAAIGQTVPEDEKKTVYFEISAAPYCYSFGSGVFLNEMLELIGAENVLAGQEGWVNVSEEAVVAANPDVILTNVNYIDAPVDEILSRAGWEGVAAVQNGDVYAVDNKTSSLPNEYVLQALEEMAQAIYPDLYA